MRFFCLFLLLVATTFAKSQEQNNIWLKTYENHKNYEKIISKITKTKSKIESNKKNPTFQEELRNKLTIYETKLSLYSKNKSFDAILLQYKFEIPTVSLREFLTKNSLEKLEKTLEKYQSAKNNFYFAKSILNNRLKAEKTKNESKKKIISLQKDIDYFEEYSENIEKAHQNLLETKDELLKQYDDYKNDVFIKHIITTIIIIILYLLYKILLFILSKTLKQKNHESFQSTSKLISLSFYLLIVVFIVVRNIDDFLYIVTFLGVIAAALTIATREIILNIAGAIYIYFSRVIKIGDRVMVQFETKHTIGDITDISLVKIRLNEIEDYTNVKEVKNVGRTIYIPNSYIFTKVFYNYALKNNGIINDLLEFEFDIENDFQKVQEFLENIFSIQKIPCKISFALNAAKTGVVALISYETHYKEVAKRRSELSILLLQELRLSESIKIKGSKKEVPTLKDSSAQEYNI